MLGLMGAMEDEVRLIRADLDDVEELDGPCELLRGRLDGTPVVLAKCGIGKVNAALAASAWFRLAQHASSSPESLGLSRPD